MEINSPFREEKAGKLTLQKILRTRLKKQNRGNLAILKNVRNFKFYQRI